MINRIVKFVDSCVRKNIHIYVFFRGLARYVSKYVALEEGFDILKFISIKSQSIAIDVGSNDGTSVSMIRHFQKSSPIVCFDPILRLKVTDKKVSFSYHGLSDNNREVTIYSPRVRNYLLWQYSSLSKKHILENLMKDFKIGPEGITFSERQISLIRFDGLDANPFFLKIDVEGHELEVLAGSKATIALHQPIILVEIQDRHQYERVTGLLHEFNYFNLMWPQAPATKDFGARMNFKPSQNNYVFLPNGISPSWGFKTKRAKK